MLSLLMPPARCLSLHRVLGDNRQRSHVIQRSHASTEQGRYLIQSLPTPSPGLEVLHTHKKSDMRVSLWPTPLEGERREPMSGEHELPRLLSSHRKNELGSKGTQKPLCK